MGRTYITVDYLCPRILLDCEMVLNFKGKSFSIEKLIKKKFRILET